MLGPEGVKTAPGDVSGRVLTHFHPNRTTGDPNANRKIVQDARISFAFWSLSVSFGFVLASTLVPLLFRMVIFEYLGFLITGEFEFMFNDKYATLAVLLCVGNSFLSTSCQNMPQHDSPQVVSLPKCPSPEKVHKQNRLFIE